MTSISSNNSNSNCVILDKESSPNKAECEGDPNKSCRVCLSETNTEKSIFETLDEDTTIISSLMQCAYPLQIMKTDELPKHICNYCFDSLQVAHKFRKVCLKSDEILREKYASRKRPLLEETKSTVSAKRICKQQIRSNKSSLNVTSNNKPKKITISRIAQGNSSKTIVIDESSPMISQLVVLPKHIRIQVAPKMSIKTGVFPYVEKNYFFNSSVIFADNYTFEVKLTKTDFRTLKCMTFNCPSYAEQKIRNGVLDRFINVKICHNHNKPDGGEIKKMVFYNKVKRRLKSDRNLPIRTVYEEACTQEPEIKTLIPLCTFIREICKHQLLKEPVVVKSFEEFYEKIETDDFGKIHYTNCGRQFYQEKFVTEDGTMGVVFANRATIEQFSDSKRMYVDASFKIDTQEDFKWQLVTVLVWSGDTYYPIVYALINRKDPQIFRLLFGFLHDHLALQLRPDEIITEYEADLYYALAETYPESNLGGSIFYYTQNLYKKICSLNLTEDLETNVHFRRIYHMLLMLPLLPVNTILDGLNSIEIQANKVQVSALARPIFDYFRTQWMLHVTPLLFCVHRLESRINENVITTFKKLRDLIALTKSNKQSIVVIVEKLIELEAFLSSVHLQNNKKPLKNDLMTAQKKNLLRAWQHIENHPKINVDEFFSRVLGFIKKMENQLWIRGFYRYDGDADEVLINASDFTNVDNQNLSETDEEPTETSDILNNRETNDSTLILEALIDQAGGVILKNSNSTNKSVCNEDEKHFEGAFMKYLLQ